MKVALLGLLFIVMCSLECAPPDDEVTSEKASLTSVVTAAPQPDAFAALQTMAAGICPNFNCYTHCIQRACQGWLECGTCTSCRCYGP